MIFLGGGIILKEKEGQSKNVYTREGSIRIELYPEDETGYKNLENQDIILV